MYQELILKRLKIHRANYVSIRRFKIRNRLPYEVKTTSYLDDFEETHRSERSVFTYKGLFFRVDEVFFSQKPFIVIECGDLDELMNNIMEDAEPFPYDLSYEELCDEVKYSLGIEPYPQE